MTGFKLRSTPVGSTQRHWLDSVGYSGDLSVTTRFSRNGGGLSEVSWMMDVPPNYDHPALRRGALIEVMDGGLSLGHAKLGEPGRGTGGLSFGANGLYRDAEWTLCFDAAGDSSTICDEIIDEAISAGRLDWAPRQESISADPVKTGSVTDSLNYLDTVLTARAEELGQFWFLDANRVPRMVPKPTAPKYQLAPGFAVPGIDDTDYATHLFARYLSGGSLATLDREDVPARNRWGGRELAVDLTALGPISDTRVNNRLAGLLARGRSTLRFTERFEVSSSELLTVGGNPADLSNVRAGEVVRVHGLRAYSQWLAGESYLDVVLGEVTGLAGASTISLTPLDFTGKSLVERLTYRGAEPLSA